MESVAQTGDRSERDRERRADLQQPCTLRWRHAMALSGSACALARATRSPLLAL